eukprot:2175991-Rhodomonas_salina.1
MVGSEAIVCLDGNKKKVHAFDILKRKSASIDTASIAPAGCDPSSDATALGSAGGAGAFVFVCGGKAAAVSLTESTS